MIRKLILALTILTLTTTPAFARGGGGGFHGGGFHGGEFRGGGFRGGHERFEHRGRFEHFRHFHRPFIGFGFSPYYYGYAPPVCSLRPGYFVNQPYVDRWGHRTYVQQWVPSRRICP